MMKHTCTRLFSLLLTGTLLMAGAITAQAAENKAQAKAQAVGLVFHADWCGSCKVMDPNIKEAREALGDAPVLFVVLDHTNDATRAQAKMMAEALGYGEIYQERGGRTGAMLLVNTESGKVIETVTRTDTPESIKAKVKAAMGG